DDTEMAPPIERMPDHVDAADPRCAAVGLENGAQDVQERSLAGAIGAKQREQLARPHLEAYVVERQRAAVTLGHAVDLDRRHRDVRQEVPLFGVMSPAPPKHSPS